MSNAILRTENLCKNYAGLKANKDICLQLHQGEIHALIGPNGAGKSTVIAQLSGELKPSSGKIFYRDQNITALPTHQRARMGLSRSFQVTSVFDDLSVYDNLALALQPHFGHSYQFLQPATADKRLHAATEDLAKNFGLDKLLALAARELAHGEKRQLEVGMTMAGNPKILLLDEPMAGIGTGGSKILTDMLDSLRGKFTLLLVEHDMAAVFALADRISVLVYGELIATGTVAEIRSNPLVQQAYLGTE